MVLCRINVYCTNIINPGIQLLPGFCLVITIGPVLSGVGMYCMYTYAVYFVTPYTICL